MRIDPRMNGALTDTWLESQCRLIEAAGRELAAALAEVNDRTQEALSGNLGRRRRITDTHLRAAQGAARTLHDVQVEVQNALFDCEQELRSLREREVDPAELLVDGERLIRQYRFLKRRARVIDGLLAYLPLVTTHANACLECLFTLHTGGEIGGLLRVPDCGFALVALEDLAEDLGGHRIGGAGANHRPAGA